MIAAVVPVGALAGAKSRLRSALPAGAAERLCLAMLADVLAALARVPSLARRVVVTPDARVAEAARSAGAEGQVRPDPGLNPAVDAAAAELAPGPDDALLVLLGDVAGARADEITRLLQAAPARGVALAPSSDGGTSALVRRPADVIPGAFGPGSAKAHRALAERVGVPCRELALASLAVDIDEPGDLATFLASDADGPRTRALLAELDLG